MSLELSLYLIACLFILGGFGIYFVRQSQNLQPEDEAEPFIGPDDTAPEAPAAVPHFDGIITARPAGMNYDTYRRIRSEQNARLRRYRKYGTLVYLASELHQVGGEVYKRIYMPFVGNTKALKLGEVLCSKRKKESHAL